MILRALLFLFVFMAAPALAAPLDMENFRKIPVLHEGRIKPIDSFARISLKFLSESEKTETQSAVEFLAQTLFDPATAVNNPVFKIADGNLRHRLKLEERKKPLYSFTELLPGLKSTNSSIRVLIQKNKVDLNKDDKALLDIYDKAGFYVSILRSFSLTLPLDISLPEKYSSLQKKELSYIDLARLQQDLSSDVKNITAKKGEDLSRYDEDERKTALLSFQLDVISAGAQGNSAFKIIPPQWQSDNSDWHAPWEVLQKGEGSPESAKILSIWRNMGDAYLEGDNQKFLAESGNAFSEVKANISISKIEAELIQNSFPPFKISTGLYMLGFIFSLGFIALPRKLIYIAAAAALFTGIVVHSVGIGLRVWLLERPPVGTLYESMIFVSLITVAISLCAEKVLKNNIGLLVGSFSGLLIGLLSFSFAGEGDTMTMLGAVLNTNFWLATHVLCITMGYGWCLLTSVFAHLALLPQSISSRLRLAQTNLTLSLLAIFSLLFTAIGTILGGIWADQSWGRFWGWDPKENGALLIVLWLIWLMHGKLGFQLSRAQYLAGLSFLSVIVAISWVGVNLLGVGLHSYGFADGYFYGLSAFTILEILLIGCLLKNEACGRV